GATPRGPRAGRAGGRAPRPAAAPPHHRAAWRAHHLRPAAETVRALAAAWSRGAPLTPAPDTAPVPGGPHGGPLRGFDTRAVLLRWLLADPAGFAALRDDPGAVVSGALDEDVALVEGRTPEALHAFHERAVRGGDPDAWVGLGLAARAGADRAGEGLLAHPELAMALHTALDGRADPLELGRALAPACP
ncbi:hypothetical protein ACFW9X_20590, partial [Streptomyces sp. NPDC059466]